MKKEYSKCRLYLIAKPMGSEERKVVKRTLSSTKNHVYFDRTLRGDLSLAECRI